MKFIKSFQSLNESKEEAIKIIEAIRNTPEGKDLCKILGVDGTTKNFDDVFNVKRTGRIYIKGVAANTFIESPSVNKYFFTTEYHGKYYGSESSSTISDLIRKIWLNLIIRKISSAGIKKEQLREWIDKNITPGRELLSNEIFDLYIGNLGNPVSDINDLLNSKWVKFLKECFNYDFVPAYKMSVQAKGPGKCDISFGFSVSTKFSPYKKPNISYSTSNSKIVLNSSKNLLEDFDAQFEAIFIKYLELISYYTANKDCDDFADFIFLKFFEYSGRKIVDISFLKETPAFVLLKAFFGVDFKTKYFINSNINAKFVEDLGVLNKFVFQQQIKPAGHVSFFTKSTDPEAIKNDFNDCFKTFIDLVISNLPWIKKAPDWYQDFIKSLVISLDDSENFYLTVKKSLEGLAKTNPIAFSKIVLEFEKSSFMPDLTKELRSEKSKLIRGGSFFSKLMGDDY